MKNIQASFHFLVRYLIIVAQEDEKYKRMIYIYSIYTLYINLYINFF